MSITSTGLSKFGRKLTSRALAERYGVCSRTLDRWTEAGILPEPMRINKVRYWDVQEIELRERERMGAARQPENAA
jgi:predicted site-specific integrase-resolvase